MLQRETMTATFARAVRVIATLAVMAAALTATTAAIRSQVGDARPANFVRLSDAIPGIVLDVRYYGADNFVGTATRRRRHSSRNWRPTPCARSRPPCGRAVSP